MSYKLEAARRFEKDFRKLPFDLRRRIDSQVRILESQPYAGKRLRGGLEGSYSLRVGNRFIGYGWEDYLPVPGRRLRKNIDGLVA